MYIDYWKMRGWTVVKADADDDELEDMDDVVRTIDDLFEIISDILGDEDFFIEVVGDPFDTVHPSKKGPSEKDAEDPNDAYDRAMKGIK